MKALSALLSSAIGLAALSACSKSKDDKDPATTATTDGGSVSSSGGSKTSSSSAAVLPLITPPVQAATPAGFLAAAAGLALDDASAYSSADIKSRFFSEGPTNLLGILAELDGYIKGVNTKAGSEDIACLTQTPVEYTIEAMGQTLTFYGQCSSTGTPTAADPQLRQFGVKDGVIYLYSAWGAERVAAIVTPLTDKPDQYQVQAWIGVGYNNAGNCGTSGKFDGCSYGVLQISADSSTKSFEMSVAGVGFGFCGIQLKSDGTNLYTDGAADGPGCAAASQLCVLSSDLVTAGSCTELSTFTLPALGRKEVVGGNTSAASTYPDTPNVTLDGSSEDSLWFGPVTATTGLGAF